jgi:hypothetical protein
MRNLKSNANLRIAILSVILAGIVLISGCIQNNEIKEKRDNILPESGQVEDGNVSLPRGINPGNNITGIGGGSGSGFDENFTGTNMPDLNEIMRLRNISGFGGSGSFNADSDNINLPDIEKYTNKSKIGIPGPNGRTYYTYVNKDPNFSINYPSDWMMLPDTSKLMFLSPPRPDVRGYFTMAMQLLSSSDSGGTYNTADDVLTDLMNQYKDNKNMSNITINYEREEVLSGYKGKELNISYSQYGFNYTHTQIVAKGGKYFYLISYVAESKHYNEYEDVYNYSKSHFKIE